MALRFVKSISRAILSHLHLALYHLSESLKGLSLTSSEV